MSLGENIRKARTAKRMSQEALARAISIDGASFGHTSISNWENNINKPDADTIVTLCKVLDVDANYLLDFNLKKAEYEERNRLENLYRENKKILTKEDEEHIEFIINKRIESENK